jgi:tetratricopeptide (TPR) repeat protein
VAGLALLLAVFGIFQLRQRSEARGWAREAEALARAGRHEEAKKLFDQARPRIEVDAALYALRESRLAEQRETAELKKKEAEILGPIRERLALLPAHPEGYRRGLALVDEAAARLPKSWDVWMRKGHLHFRLAEPDEALAAYARALELNPALGAARYWRGRILMEMKRDLEGAAKELALAESDNEYAQVARARIEVIRGNSREALRLCDQAAAAGKHLGEFHFLRGYAYSDARSEAFDPDRAIAAYSEAIRLNPKDGAYFVNRALARRAKGDRAGSTADFSEAIRLSPELPEGWMGRGINYDMEGRQQEALDDYEGALRADPNHARSLGYRGRIRFERGDLEGARADLDRSIAAGARNVMVYEHRALVRRGLGDPRGALDGFAEAIRSAPEVPQPYMNRAETRAALGDREGALEDYASALRAGGPGWSDRDRVQKAIDRLKTPR